VGWVLLVVLVAWPIAEVACAALVADHLGWGSTLLLLLALSVVGIIVLRAASRRTRRGMARGMARLDDPGPDATSTLAASRAAAAAADTSLLFVAGILLLVPGFVTGLLGLVLLIPPVRTVLIAVLGGWFGRRVRRNEAVSGVFTRIVVWGGGDVVPGQVVRPDDPPGPGGPADPPGPALPPGSAG
jgi:UPF0716 protein FxsA